MAFKPTDETSLLTGKKDDTPKPSLPARASYWLNLISAVVLLGTFITFCSEYLTKKLIIDTDALGLLPYVIAEMLNLLGKEGATLWKALHASAPKAALNLDEEDPEIQAAVEFVHRNRHPVSEIALDLLFQCNIILPIFACINSMAHRELQESNGYFFTSGFFIGLIDLVRNLWKLEKGDASIPKKLSHIASNPLTALLLLVTTGVGFGFIDRSPLRGNEGVICATTACFFLLVVASHIPDTVKGKMNQCMQDKCCDPLSARMGR